MYKFQIFRWLFALAKGGKFAVKKTLGLLKKSRKPAPKTQSPSFPGSQPPKKLKTKEDDLAEFYPEEEVNEILKVGA